MEYGLLLIDKGICLKGWSLLSWSIQSIFQGCWEIFAETEEFLRLLLSVNWIHIPCIIVEIFPFSPITNCSCKWTFHAEGVSWGEKKKKKKKKIWLAVTVCPFPAFLAYFLLPFRLWWQRDTFLNDTTHVCLNSIVLILFWKCPGLQVRGSQRDSCQPEELTGAEVSDSLRRPCTLCSWDKAVYNLDFAPASICLFWAGHVSLVKNRAGQFCALKDRAGRVVVSVTKIDAFLGLLGS